MVRRFCMPSLAQRAGALALTVLAACAPTWRHVQTATAVGAIGMLACDGGTTDEFLNAHTAWSESNPILGERPSDARLWGYLGAIAVGIVVANRKLSPKWATLVNGLVLGAEIKSVAWNMHVGSSACGVGEGGPWLNVQPMSDAPAIGARPR